MANDMSQVLVRNALVVDDSRSMRELIAGILGNHNIKVVQAEDGESAFRALDQSMDPIDLIFCDLAMPGIDGVETMRGLAIRHFNGGVVLLSGLDSKLMSTVSDMATQLGIRMLGTIGKPFTEDQIAAVIEKYRTPQQQRLQSRMMRTITGYELDEALEEDRLEVYYQPQVRMSDEAFVGVEALVRLNHPAYGLVEPDAFISVAEDSPQRITRLTLSVLEKAIQQAGVWARGGLDLNVAVNLSTLAIRRLDLPEIVQGMAQKAGVPNDRIVLEMTESQVMSSAEILHIVSRFRLHNFKLSIDDFGTGQSGLQRLKRLPFTELKIDRGFVHGAADDPDLRSILESSIDLGRRLRMEIVAEGVERWSDWRLLKELGCDVVQGFIAARPVAAQGIPLFAERWASRKPG